MILLLLSLACSPKTLSSPKPVLIDETGEVIVSEADVNGTAPILTLDLPDFSVVNSDGSSRKKENLQGSPSVIWFYPVAGTPG